ncbi:type II secretion system protein [Caldifermentibacillus hisashii]|uniref:type II secretion system protein n=1 Tax=Caldifermentibacillus hisashii TaxID=996558 RepID=UPI0031B72B45
MQKRIKLLKNQKGMTLVELLAVLVILGIIAAIAIPMIGNMIENSQTKAAANEALNIIAGAKLADSNGVKGTTEDNVTTFSKDDLVEYVDEDNFISVTKTVKKDTKGEKVTSVEWAITGHKINESTNDDLKSGIESKLKKFVDKN